MLEIKTSLKFYKNFIKTKYLILIKYINSGFKKINNLNLLFHLDS